jgi:hypothetical protein
MPYSWPFNWESMATKERENLETRCVERLLFVYVCVFAISNRCPKDSSSAHKGLMTNYSMLSSPFTTRTAQLRLETL